MKTKKSCLRLAILLALLGLLLLCIGLYSVGDLWIKRHQAAAERICLERVYYVLSKYRENHGQWPATINDAAAQPNMPSASGTDAIFHRPWLYYPSAKPGTKEVLVAVPDVVRMDWLPFIGWQDAVLVDGTYADFRSSAVIRRGGTDEGE